MATSTRRQTNGRAGGWSLRRKVGDFDLLRCRLCGREQRRIWTVGGRCRFCGRADVVMVEAEEGGR